mmetsp:Transcript_31231/g.35820  ORF Transcript_31231/g.35820 Transcript_31231/m.35820 type:complete len:119 (-) Transcript_31231:155-511(-)
MLVICFSSSSMFLMRQFLCDEGLLCGGSSEERTTWSDNFGGPSVQLRVHDQGLVERLGVIDHDFVDGDVIKTKSYMQPTDGQQQQVYKMPELTTPHHTTSHTSTYDVLCKGCHSICNY